MHISWLGNSTVRIQTKHQGENVDLVIDPYKTDAGNMPRSLTTNIALLSRGEDNAITLSGDPFVVDKPGEFETKGIFIHARATTSGLIFYFESEHMTVAHVGCLSKDLENGEFELIASADILILPVGSNSVITADTAVTLATKVEPRVIIPVCYHSAKGEKWDSADKFVKALGLEPLKEKKYKVTRKELPEEETLLVLLERASS